MATPTQIAANRINAHRSTGPRTPEGKSAVAQNRTTHGFTGAFSVLPCEDRDAYRELLEAYIDEYRPDTPTQQFFVTELGADGVLPADENTRRALRSIPDGFSVWMIVWD